MAMMPDLLDWRGATLQVLRGPVLAAREILKLILLNLTQRSTEKREEDVPAWPWLTAGSRVETLSRGSAAQRYGALPFAPVVVAPRLLTQRAPRFTHSGSNRASTLTDIATPKADSNIATSAIIVTSPAHGVRSAAFK
jgi:hypothetical protein